MSKPPPNPPARRERRYTESQLHKCKCFRCGAPARFQWNICSDDNIWRPLCGQCDLDLNAMVLEWFGKNNWEVKLRKYARLIGLKWEGKNSTSPI